MCAHAAAMHAIWLAEALHIIIRERGRGEFPTARINECQLPAYACVFSSPIAAMLHNVCVRDINIKIARV